MSIDEQIEYAEREIKMLESIDTSWGKGNHAQHAHNEHGIACMKAILGTLKRVQFQEQGSLF